MTTTLTINGPLAQPPNLLKTGMLLFLGLVIVLSLLGFFIRYEELTELAVTIDYPSAPQEIVSPFAGKVKRLLVKEGEQVQKGQALVEMDRAIDSTEFKELTEILLRLGNSDQKTWKRIRLPSLKALGHLQSPYNAFKLGVLSANRNQNKVPILEKKEALLSQKLSFESLIESIKTQKVLLEEEILIAKEDLVRFEKLYSKKALTASELSYQKTQVLVLQRQSIELDQSIISTQIDIQSVQIELSEMGVNAGVEAADLSQKIEENYYLLKEAVDRESQIKSIQANASGKVVFPSPSYNGKYYLAGEEIMRIVPKNAPSTALGKLAQKGAGKIIPNQEVKIKLLEFPHKEFGYLRGSVLSIASDPVDGYYQVNIEIHAEKTPATLKKYRSGMKGTALIKTGKKRIWQTIFQLVKS